MLFFYLMTLLPLIIWLFAWKFMREITFLEAIGCFAASLLVALIFQIASIAGMTADVETWSGQITASTFYPEWIEEYQEQHSEEVASGTDSNGNTTYTTHYWTTTEHRTHGEYWDADTTLNEAHNIEQSEFNEIRNRFKNLTIEQPYKGGFDGGDPNIYVSYNKTGFVFPATTLKRFENRIKAAPTVFSFSKVPETVKVFDYPKNKYWRISDRLLGTALKDFDQFKFDQMCAELGPKMLCNVIIIGFDSDDSQLGDYQRAKFIGGKKNDLVICYGKTDINGKPSWVKCFGWTEKELVEKNLETIFLDNEISTALLPAIKREVIANYQLKDWTKFDYISVEPPTWTYFVFLFVLIVTNVAMGIWVIGNEFQQDYFESNPSYSTISYSSRTITKPTFRYKNWNWYNVQHIAYECRQWILKLFKV